MAERNRRHTEQVIVRFVPEDKARIDRLVAKREMASLIRELVKNHLDEIEGVQSQQLELEGVAA